MYARSAGVGPSRREHAGAGPADRAPLCEYDCRGDGVRVAAMASWRWVAAMAYSWGKGRAAGTASSTPLGRWIGQERRRRINRTPGQYTRAAATSTATARRRRARPRRRGGARGRRRRPRRPPAATGRGPGARRRSAARARPRLRFAVASMACDGHAPRRLREHLDVEKSRRREGPSSASVPADRAPARRSAARAPV